jgi:hypothetical protein
MIKKMMNFTNALDFDFDIELNTKYGIDKLELIINFLTIIEGTILEENIKEFTIWLEIAIKRHLTDIEEKNLYTGIINYLQSDPGTNERTLVMNDLFNLNFLDEETNIE